jgi:drug/metabolite transporter (DMT)-like permease
VLGAILAVLSGASFALNNAAARRAVLTGTPIQGMAVTVPIGVLCFLPIAFVTGELPRLAEFPAVAAAWMAGVGLLHFLFGRYCNYRANQSAGANLSGPVIQMQVIVTLALAVIVLTEPCTLLQMLGGVVMLGGSLVTQSQHSPRARARMSSAMDSAAVPSFVPRYAEGMLFGSLAAIAYGTTPIMVRMALRHSGPSSAILGGLIAYASATVGIAVLVAFSIPLQRNVMALRRESMPWFVYSGVMVALAQGFLYSAVAVAPIMLVVPLQQSSVVFRLVFSRLLNPTHEVFGARVIIGAALSIIGACTVSIDSSLILNAVGAPGELARLLQWRI